MKTLIKSALVLDPRSDHHQKKRDILIDKGKIIGVGSSFFESRVRLIREEGLCISPGWIDLRANFRDPGHEYKEDLTSGIRAAKKGGFTRVVLMPSTFPVADNKSAIEYILSKTKDSPVRILPAGTLSEKMDGRQMSEMFDMFSAGAVCFTDDKSSVDTELMIRALEYTKNFDGLIFSFPLDNKVNPGGIINEGPTSVAMGLKGLSSLSEELRLTRDIDILRYSGGKLHISLISTAKSVALVRAAKKEGLRITCAIAAHQLSFLDEDMMGFDSNLKVNPPFRSSEDRTTLIAGLSDGTIDAICSDHSPEDTEHKVREFEYANDGISSIETAFCSAFTALEKHLNIETIVKRFSTGPASVLGIELPIIEEGSEADLTLFSSKLDTLFTDEEWQSKSKNSPYINKTLRGKIIPL